LQAVQCAWSCCQSKTACISEQKETKETKKSPGQQEDLVSKYRDRQSLGEALMYALPPAGLRSIELAQFWSLSNTQSPTT
jgi:hypothetical protein